MSEGDFDWRSDDSIVIRQCDSVAVYVNPRRQVVLRAEADAYDDGDRFIYLDPLRVPALIKALRAAAREAKNEP